MHNKASQKARTRSAQACALRTLQHQFTQTHASECVQAAYKGQGAN